MGLANRLQTTELVETLITAYLRASSCVQDDVCLLVLSEGGARQRITKSKTQGTSS